MAGEVFRLELGSLVCSCKMLGSWLDRQCGGPEIWEHRGHAGARSVFKKKGAVVAAAKDLGSEAVRRIAKLWQVDAERVLWTEQGFDWWPGRFRVSVIAQNHHDEHDAAWRLVIRTDFLKDVPVEDFNRRKNILMMSSLAPSYSWVFTPPEITAEYEIPEGRDAWFHSTAYLREDTAGWLPEFFGRLAILQPIQAAIQSEAAAELLGGQVNVSLPTENSSPNYADEILGVADALYVPAGQNESRWIGSDEFEEVANRFGRQDTCFGMGNRTGLTLETPIGSDSALIRLLTDAPHPVLGNGLLSTVELPFWQDEDETVEHAMMFNFMESVQWTDVPQLGSWHAREVAAEGFCAASASFYPNLLYSNHLVTNAALWQLGRARWIKNQFYPDLVNKTMAEILKKRVGQTGD